MGGRRRKRRVEPTDDWEQLALLCGWPEQLAYEEIRPLTLFGSSVAERAAETGIAERTLYRRVGRFEEKGMESLFAAEPARFRRLPPAMRRLIVDRKAEYPAFSLGELARICYVAFGRRPSKHTVKRVLEEGPTPLMPVRRYPPYHEMPVGEERRRAIVELHADGWTAKAVAGYLKTSETTVYRALRRWAEEGVDGLEDKPRGRPRGSGKVTFPRHERRPAHAGESRPGRLPRPRRLEANGHPPKPGHLREDHGREPQGLRPREAQGRRGRRAEADALRLGEAPRVLER